MKGYRWLGLAALLALLLVAVVANAQTGDGRSSPLSTGYEVSWWTVDGGGYTFSEGGGYTLGGTIGQPDAGEVSGGGYTLGGGFWGSIVEYLQRLFLPLIFKNYGP